MSFKYLALFFILLLSSVHSLYGQWDAQMSQYWRAKTYYNPAFAGDAEAIDNTLFHRQQWLGVNNAPKTSIGTMTMPVDFLGMRHGVGVVIFNEKIGLFSNKMMAGQYAYKFKFSNKKYFNIGLQLAYTNIDFDAAQIHIPNSPAHDPTDPAIPTAGGDKIFDSALGISWTTPKYWVGFSATHLLDPTFDLDDTHSSYIARSYYLMGGYNIQLSNPLVVLQPSAFIKTDAVAYQLDVTGRVEYNNMFNGGISWRKDDGFVFLLGIKIKNIDACYSYDLNTSALASNGSHEISVRYIIPLDKKQERRSRKSVRIL